MEILQIHQTLNNIYDIAEKVNDYLQKQNYKTSLQSYNHHYININGKYVEQNYYMPVITVENKGDIYFNLNQIGFEFYIKKEEIENINLEELIKEYRQELNVYEYKNCTIDLYTVGDTLEEVLKKIKKSKDHQLGISIQYTSLTKEEILKHFRKVCTLLKKV